MLCVRCGSQNLSALAELLCLQGALACLDSPDEHDPNRCLLDTSPSRSC